MEAAGLVLAVLPLLINGLKGMAAAAGTFDKLRKPSKEYSRYGRNLKRELAIYKNTLTELLEGIVEGDDDLQEMMVNAQSPLWGQYDGALRQRLDKSYDIFLDTIEEVEEELQILVKKLKLKPRLEDDNGDLPEDFWAKELHRFKMAFNSDAYQEIYDHVKTLNDFLTNTTQASLRLEDKRTKKKVIGTKHCARIKRLREHARNIHKSVTTNACWKCNCQHNAMLRVRPDIKKCLDLDGQPWRIAIGSHKSSSQPKDLHVLEMQPEEEAKQSPIPNPAPATSSTSTTSAIVTQNKIKKSIKWQLPQDQQITQVVSLTINQNPDIHIQDLCSILINRSPQSDDLGFIESHDKSWKCRVKYHRAGDDAKTESLGEMLIKNAMNNSASRVVFSREERLAAAATLAVSVLFLDGSWLKPIWTNSDILLVREADRVVDKHGARQVINELAFSWVVCAPVIVDAEAENKSKKLKMHRKTAILFALAMALIELSLGKPLEQMKTDEERAEDFLSSNLGAASRLLLDVQAESGFEYQEVVRKCLDCPFDIGEPSMDNDRFVAVYLEEIARPLMNDYEKFIGVK